MEIQLKDNDRVLIVHHWDCDGICSAALIMRRLLESNSDINIFTGTGDIGKYYLAPERMKAFEKIRPHHIVLCDYALPENDMQKLKALAEDLIIFDHHRQEEVKQAVHINPFLRGDMDGLMYPSTGWVINSHLCRPQEILAVLGAVGDQEDLVKEDIIINRVLEEKGLDFDQAQEIVVNIDSCYIAGDEEQIRRLVRLLRDAAFDVKRLLDDRGLLENREKIGSTIRDIVEGDKDIDDHKKTVYVSYVSSYHIISSVARELARRFPGYLAIAVNDPGAGEANIYFRTTAEMDLRPVIDLAHKNGYNSGGKKEVAGVILPSGDISGFIESAMALLEL